MRPEQCIARYDALESDRSAKDDVLDLVDRFVIPGRGRLYTRDDENAVDYKHRELYDETAGLSAQTLAASIHGAMTSPAIKWFQFAFRDEALNIDTGAAGWLAKCRDIIYNDLMDSNFNTEVIETYLSDVTFGDAVLGHTISPEGEDHFLNHDIKGVYYEMDFKDRPKGLYVKREYTALQIYDEFGWAPEALMKLIDENSPSAATDKWEVIQAIYFDHKNKDEDTSKVLGAEKRPFQEKFILVDGAEQLNKDASGYYEFPAYIIRWGRVAGSKHSFSPAINCLGTILSLNQLIEVILCQAEKAVDPPILTIDRGVLGDVDMRAGGQTTVRSLDAIKEFVSNARFDVSQLERQQLVNAIRQSFYVDQLELKESPAMTATEANIRYELMQRLLGPALTRIRIDLLDRLLERKFYAAFRMGRLPEPPQNVIEAGAAYDIEYIGPWSRAQKADSVMAMEQSLMYVAQLAGAVSMPELLDNFDTDGLMRQIAIDRGMAPKYIVDTDKVEGIRTQRAQRQAQASEMAQMQAGSEVMKNIGQSGMVPGGAPSE